MAGNTVVVLGGGTGGIVAAQRLRRELAADDRVVVERDRVYRFAPSFLWVLTGARRPEQISTDLGPEHPLNLRYRRRLAAQLF